MPLLRPMRTAASFTISQIGCPAPVPAAVSSAMSTVRGSFQYVPLVVVQTEANNPELTMPGSGSPRVVLTKGVFAKVVEHSEGEAMRSHRVALEEVRPKLILIVAPHPEPLVNPNIEANSRRIKSS